MSGPFGEEQASRLTKDPVEAMHLFVADYSRAMAQDAALGVKEGEPARTETIVAMFLSHWTLRLQSEVNMEHAAQAAWQHKAKAVVTAMSQAFGEFSTEFTGHDPYGHVNGIWDKTIAKLRPQGYDDETIASLIQ